ncbi:MAG TPA: peptidase [Pseudomonas sabulinigri]|nr:peptidase [Halopseudomonas sabulinigri]HEC53433.1 peptidase [Halopseudomonas sabulinigri]
MFFGLGSGALMADDDVRLDEANSLIEQGTIKKFDELNEKALSVQPGTITDTDLDKHYGRYVYQVEIKDAQGQEWDVDLDASNGEVLEHKQDD